MSTWSVSCRDCRWSMDGIEANSKAAAIRIARETHNTDKALENRQVPGAPNREQEYLGHRFSAVPCHAGETAPSVPPN